MSMFKLNDVLSCLISWGRSQPFQNEGAPREAGADRRSQPFQNEGAPREAGADRDSNWRLSIDPCRKCHFIWGLKGDGFLTEGAQAPRSDPLSYYVPA